MPTYLEFAHLTTTLGSTQILTRTLYHDRMRRLNGIANTNASGTVTRHGYALDGAGRRVRAIRENGQRWDYGYDDVGQVTSAVKKFPDASAIPGHTFAYAFDGIGNRTSATHGGTGNDVTYTPNGLNQYSNIATDGGRFILGEAPVANDVFINDDTTPAVRSGGLTFFSKHITETNTTPLWSLDTITSNNVTISGTTWTPAASVAPVHDFDGNLTYDGRWIYSWDAENRLTRMQTTHAAATAGVPRQRLDFVYDSEGRRVAKYVSTCTDGTNWTLASDLRFLYDGWNLIAEYEMLYWGEYTYFLKQATHVWGIDLSGTPQGAGGVGGLLCSTLEDYENSITRSYFPAFDGNGNVSAWVSQNGALVGRMDYSPFGQLIAQYKFTQSGDNTLTRLPFGFSTKYTDKETGHLYYIKRYYGPVSGRWLSKDPIEEKGGVNLYGFVRNDSLNGIDIFGLFDYTEIKKQLRKGGETALAEAEKDLKQRQDKFDNKRPENRVGEDRPWQEFEYGGRVCGKCIKNDDGSLKYEYYNTDLYSSGSSGSVDLTRAKPCKDKEGYQQVGSFHNHPKASPSQPWGEGLSGGNGRDLGDKDVARTGKDRSLNRNHGNPLPENESIPPGLPVSATYRDKAGVIQTDFFPDFLDSMP